MYATNSRRVNRAPLQLDLQEQSGLTDTTFFEAEHIPVKVYMKPHHCASDPRLRIDLKSLCSSPVVLKADKKKCEDSGPRKALDREKLIKLHARAASDIISAVKTEAKSPDGRCVRKQVATRHGKKPSLTLLPTVAPPAGSQSVKHKMLAKGRSIGNLSPVLSRGLLASRTTGAFPVKLSLKFR